MSLIVSPYEHSNVQRQEIRLPPIEIPAPLKEDFAVNSHLEPVFYQTVAKALNVSLNTPETALRVVTVEALKQRIELCYSTIVTLRYELKYSLRKCLDMLPALLTEALVKGERVEDLYEKQVNGTSWAKDSPDEQMVTNKNEDMTEEQQTDDTI